MLCAVSFHQVLFLSSCRMPSKSPRHRLVSADMPLCVTFQVQNAKADRHMQVSTARRRSQLLHFVIWSLVVAHLSSTSLKHQLAKVFEHHDCSWKMADQRPAATVLTNFSSTLPLADAAIQVTAK